MAKRRHPKIRFLLFFALAGLLLAAIYTVYLDFTVRARFEGKRFALPARVYARPLELYPGLGLRPAEMNTELALLDYRETPHPLAPGTYHWSNDTLDLVTRPFVFADGPQEAISLRVEFGNGQVRALRALAGDKPLPLVRLDPALIGGIYPGKNEDRVLVKLADVPRQVVDALIAVEDRRFYSHHGIDPRGIARATPRDGKRRERAGRQHSDPAARQEFLPDRRAHAAAKAHRNGDGGPAGDPLPQRRDPRNLPQ